MLVNRFQNKRPNAVLQKARPLASMLIARFLIGVLSLFFALAGTIGAAQAQDVDWLVNGSDTGFDPVPAGGTISYSLSVTNNGFGPANAPATTISLIIPAGATFTGATGTITGCAPATSVGPSTVVCNVPSLAPLAQAALVANVLSSTSGTITLGASVPTAGDTVPANNTLTEGTTVTAGADISLALTVPATASAGSNATYSFVATNNGPNTASNVVLSFPVPTGLVNVTPPSGCTLSGSTYSCTIAGPIAVGGTAARDFVGQISAGSGSTVTGLGSVSGGTPADPISLNNSATGNTAVTAGSDLSITKARSPSGTLLVGNAVNFTLTPRYTGDSPNMILVADTIPANYTVTGVTAPGWTCTSVLQQVECTRTSGTGPGANVALGPITVATTVASAGTPTNTATIGAAGPVDPVMANNTASDGGATISNPTIDLLANKTGPVPALVVQGNSYSFAISTSNIGNAAFVGTARMVDSVPAGLQVTAYNLNGWTCTPAVPVTGPTPVTCTRVYTAGAPLAAGATTPAVSLTTLATGTGTMVNTLTVSAPISNWPDLNPGNDVTSYIVDGSLPAASADISVVKTASLATLPAGDIQTFSIRVINSGAIASTNVTLTDNLLNLINSSAGATAAGFIDATIAHNGVPSGTIACSTVVTGGTSRRLTCTIPSLPVCTVIADCPEITVRIRPGGAAGARSNTASVVSSSTADWNLGNNSGTANYAIEARADVTVSKSSSPTTVAAGQNVTYVLTARNLANGLSPADAVTVTDTLPANMTFISASPSSGSCATLPTVNSTTGPGNNSMICNLGTIANGSQQTVTVVLRPNLITRGTTLTNNVVVVTSTIETNGTNNSASVNTIVSNPVIDLLINKDDSVDPLPISLDTVYKVDVTNLGPSAAENVVVTDTMPVGQVSYLSHTLPADGTCGSVPAVGSLSGTLQCTFPSIPAGQTRTILVTGHAVAKGTATNTATVASAETGLGFEPNTANNTSVEQTTVRTRADIEVVSKVATPATVNVRDPFTWLIILRNNTGSGLAEADNVALSDTLPSNMVLTGAPVANATVGTISTNACTGAVGGTSFTCDFGTLSSGGTVEITVPVRILTITSNGQSFTNSTSVTTTSLDAVPGNNSNSGSVVVNGSSLAGTVFRDFGNDGGVTSGDTGISGVTMTLTGTAFDGSAVTRTVSTDGSGNYSFGLLPQSNSTGYTVTQGSITETYLTNGTTSAGTSGGSSTVPTVISGIVLDPATAATGYLFPKIPQARVAIAKALQSGPTVNLDGTIGVTFRLNVRNLSLEGLASVVVSDTLDGVAPLFGTYTASTPTVPGTYTMAAAPSGTCGGLNAGYNGSSNTNAATGFTMALGASCTIDLQVQFVPTSPLPPVLAGGERYQNQATVNAVGVLSAQTTSDLSDNGTNPDPDGDGQGNEAGENDPTPVTLSQTTGIRLVKSLTTMTDTTGDGVIGAGDTATYSFAVTNTGSVALAGVTVTDPMVTVSGGPINLAIGATNSSSFTASYVLVQADIDRGYIENTASTTGNAVAPDGSPILDAGGSPIVVTDVSDTGTTADGSAVAAPETTETPNGTGGTDLDPTNDPTVWTLAPEPRIVLVKSLVSLTDTTGNGVIGAGDTVAYSFAVTNTGNVALAGVTVTDPLVAVSGGPINLAIGATNNSTFTAAYTLQQADVDRGYVQNTATTNGNAVTSTGTPILDGSSNPVTTADVSDTGTAADGSTIAAPATTETPDGAGSTDADPTNDPTVALLSPAPRIVLVKSLVGVADTNADGLRNAGDTATYAFTVINTGATALINVTVSDPLVTLSGGPIPLLAVGGTDTTTYTATYVILQADVDRGYFDNTATVIGEAATTAGVPILNAGNPVTATDVSDTGTAPNGSAVGTPATVETPSGAGVTDADTTNDPTSLLLGPDAQIQLVKSLVSVTDTTGDGLIGTGDTAAYTFAVTNTGNVALAGVTVTDPLLTVVGGPIDLAIAGSDTSTFTGNYTIQQSDVDRGYLENTATATGNAVTSTGAPILDAASNPVTANAVSDTGTLPDGSAVATPETTETPDGAGATDADPTNDPTVWVLSPEPRIVLVKSLVSMTDTTGDGVIGAGDTAAYSFAVTNVGNIALGGVTVTDPLVAVSGGPVNLAIGATDSTSFTAAYVLQQADVDRGYVENTATTTGNAVTSTGTPILDASSNPVTTSDVSDTGTAPDGTAVAAPATTETPDGAGATDADPTNDPTVALIQPEAGIRLVKRLVGSTDVNGNGFVDLGDILNYAFDVTNTGNVALADLSINDPLVAVVGGPVSLAMGATDSSSFTASYTLTPADITRTYVENTATTSGTAVTGAGVPILDGGNPIVVTDVSDTGTDPAGDAVTDPETTETPDGTGATDGDATNDPTVYQVGKPEIQLDINITDIPDVNGNGIIDAGDRVVYSFTVTNTGDLDLRDVNLDLASLTLPLPGLTCASISLAVGETATLVCTGNAYTITPADVTNGTVSLSGSAVGESLVGQVVTDDDAVVSPAFGLGGLSITKTVDRSQVSVGEVVTYTITVSNASTTQTTLTNVVDVLPVGFIYQSGTATVAGTTADPVISGRRLTWQDVSLAPGSSTAVVLDVLISASATPGDHDNVARGVSPLTGRAVTADAIATVRVAADPVFACSTVIGRVFDDLNQDGYYNGEPKQDRVSITDQTYYGGKYGAPEKPDREKGLPGVRLVAPNGLAITTDQFGRFSVPCAALPANIGSNFMLKLDTRTLPSGYRLTTENPRVVRVTPGMLTKMNFGATISRVVRIDLGSRAFGDGNAARQPTTALDAGLKKLVAEIANTPTVLRLSYQLSKGESEKLAKQRMREVEKVLRRLWPANGRYQLNVETVIQRRAAKAVNE